MTDIPDVDVTAESTARPTQLSTGTTVVGLAGTDGVVIGADARASLGGRFVTNQSMQKVEPIGDRTAVAFSGGVSDAQALVDQLRAERRLYELEHDRTMTPRSLANRAGALIRCGQFRSLWLVLGGVGDEPAVYEIGGGGGVMADDVAASGSGMQLAYGTLERAYEPGRSVETLRTTAANALEAAAERDAASGDGMTIATVTGDGIAVERTTGLGVEALSTAEDVPVDDARDEGVN